MTLNGQTTVTFTMGQLLASVLTLVLTGGAVLWGVVSFTIGGVREDIGAIRQATQGLQVADKESAIRVRDTEGKLGDQLGAVRVEIAGLSGKLEATAAVMVQLNMRINEMQRLVTARQAALTDPRNAAQFASFLRSAAGDDQKIVIVPYDPLTFEKK